MRRTTQAGRAGLVGLALAAAVLTGCGSPSDDAAGGSGAAPSAASSATPSAPGAGGGGGKGGGDDRELLEIESHDVAEPTQVRIPSLGIVSDGLDPLDVVADGTLETPPEWDLAGWYAGGPRPGEIGPAVVAGHVDSPTGPAVFTGLEQIEVGASVEVEDADGVVHEFRVDRLAAFPRDDFPTEAVYGPTPDAQLRLITCDGAYDAETGYTDNLIVYATAVTA